MFFSAVRRAFAGKQMRDVIGVTDLVRIAIAAGFDIVSDVGNSLTAGTLSGRIFLYRAHRLQLAYKSSVINGGIAFQQRENGLTQNYINQFFFVVSVHNRFSDSVM